MTATWRALVAGIETVTALVIVASVLLLAALIGAGVIAYAVWAASFDEGVEV